MEPSMITRLSEKIWVWESGGLPSQDMEPACFHQQHLVAYLGPMYAQLQQPPLVMYLLQMSWHLLSDHKTAAQWQYIKP